MHAEARPRVVLNLRAATALADMIGGACGGDGASRRRIHRMEVQMRTSTKAKGKTSAPTKQTRQAGKATERVKSKNLRRGRSPGSERTPKPGPAATAPRQSKQAAVIALLRRSEGVTVDEVVAATGWQPHTVRGLFSGTLKKKLGLALSSAHEERGRVYRISNAGDAGEQARAGS